MGLRCLLGHDFDEPETERERNEEGNEVVVTVREVKTCKRCGEKQVVSENKEITSIDQLRETATGEPVDAEGGAGGEWSTDDLGTGSTEETTPADTASTASTPAAEESESESVEPEQDPVERGVADIIEQAEKDDDMLQQPPAESSDGEAESGADEGDETEDADDDVPVHPGQRSAAAEESESADAEGDDGVILDEEDALPPEEGRRQWEEEASPEEVPGDDLSVGESSAPEGDDAEIIDPGADQPAAEREPSEPEPSGPDVGEPAESSSPSAVESEDAEIMDAGPEPSGSQSEPEPTQPEPTESEPAEPSSEPEETDEGHMPWPEAPGEDDGHDASAPDGEPADIDFGGLTSDPDEAEAETDAETAVECATEDQANGHRTESGESSDASTAPTANVDLERSSRDAELEYYCPECGLTRDVGNSSMRAGDICPECRVGYITEQQKAE